MRKKLFCGILGGGIVLFAVFAIVYHLPLDRSGTYVLTVLNRPEDTAAIYETAEREITLHRFFFRPTLVRGKITLGERTYPDILTKFTRAYDSYSFAENLRRKADGVLDGWFVPENSVNTEWLDDY
ncbi:MAG: hypothetical protein II333_02695, partial [Clostridia bacterium]|nr:hypothetical protein [Clostridia bacterium]